MARLCLIKKEERRLHLIEKFASRREQLRNIIRDPKVGLEEKLEAQRKMQALPRDSNRCRRRNRCMITGRARGVYRKFGLGRTKIRELMNQGKLAGIRKASW